MVSIVTLKVEIHSDRMEPVIEPIVRPVEDVIHQFHHLLGYGPRRLKISVFKSVNGRHFNTRMGGEDFISLKKLLRVKSNPPKWGSLLLALPGEWIYA